MDLNMVQLAAKYCKLCDLCKNRIKPVFGRGNPNADIVICGMCPGPDENRVGLPFVGTAGKILDKILGEVFTKPHDHAYITNLVKCFVQPGTILKNEWMTLCLPYFLAQMHFVKPKVIIALGKDVTSFFIPNNNENMSTMRKHTYYDYMGAILIPTYHPSYLARGGGIKHRHFNIVVEDFRRALKYI